MAIFKNKHYGNFTQIDNALIRNRELSRKAKMLLIEMLSYPEDWKFTIAFLESTGKDKKDAIHTMLNELEEFGYVICEKFRNEKGRFDSRYTVCETPCKDNATSPKTPAEKNAGKKSRCEQSDSNEPERKNRHGIPLYNKKRVTKTDLQKESEKTAHAEKQKFGKYENVLLAPEEYSRLVETYGKDQTDRSIEGMSDYMQIHNKSYPNVFARLDLWIRQDIEKAKQSLVPCQSKESDKKSNSDFDVSMYKIFINNFESINLEEEEIRKKYEEKEERREEEKRSYAEREKAERDAHFAELIAHMQKHQAKNENVVDSVTPDYSAFMNDYVTI